MPADSQIHRRGYLVELAGPAGAGKSATRRLLIERSPARHGSIWGLPVAPLLLNGLALVPGFIPLWQEARAPLWNEARHMVRLHTLHIALDRQNAGPNAIVFDEGPVFALSWLRGFGHPVMRSPRAEQWWEVTLSAWARLIDTIVVLDAPDRVLAQRIRGRPQDHEIKRASDLEFTAWMARFREALDWVLTRLALENTVTVLRLDTSVDTPDQLAERALAALDQVSHAG